MHRQNGILAVILVKEFWNLCDLLVDPKHHKNGIDRSLAERAISICEMNCPKQTLRVNSSHNAIGFYRKIGFAGIDIDKELPFDCLPLAYQFQHIVSAKCAQNSVLRLTEALIHVERVCHT